jgi:hypothetical protein
MARLAAVLVIGAVGGHFARQAGGGSSGATTTLSVEQAAAMAR